MKPSIEEAIAMLQRLGIVLSPSLCPYLTVSPLSILLLRQEDDMKSVNDKFQDVMAYYRKYAFHILTSMSCDVA